MTDRTSNLGRGNRLNPAAGPAARAVDCSCGLRLPESPPCADRRPDRRDASVNPGAGDRDGEPVADGPVLVSISDLIDRIVRVNHGRLRHELPLLLKLADDVADAYGCQNPVLGEVRAVLGALKEDLDTHMIKEEWVVFPTIERWESARIQWSCLEAPEGSFEPLEVEHEHASATLVRLRTLTDGVSAQLSGCALYRVLLEGLATLESDLEQHVREEKDRLFPQACVTAALLRARSALESDSPVEDEEGNGIPSGQSL